MKASEVITSLAKLIEMHGDLEVSTEGCDCDGDVALITFEEIPGFEPPNTDRYFYLRRSKERTGIFVAAIH